MALLASGQPTMADVLKRTDPTGKIAVVAELLSQTNEIMEDIVPVEGNLPTGHRFQQRVGLPSVFARLMNQGVPVGKSITNQIDVSTTMLEARAHLDVEVYKLNGSRDEFRMSEDAAFLEAMNQAMVQQLIYGNLANDPTQILGFAPQYNAISGAGNAQNIIDAGGVSTNNTSIWLVVHGADTVYCPYPKGTSAGLEYRDLGEIHVTDANGNFYQALASLYNWKFGLAVQDWRYVVRICNINTANLVAETSAANLIKLMSRAIDRIPNIGKGRPAFYMNRTVYEMLRIQALNTSSNALAIEPALNQFGMAQKWTTFQGIPLRKVDRIITTEARIV